MSKQWFRALFRRKMLIILLLIIQAGVLLYLINSGSRLSHIISNLLTVLSALIALHIIAKKDKGAYKTTWVFLILVFPIFSGLLYLLFLFQSPTRKMEIQLKKAEEKAGPLFFLPGSSRGAAKQQLGSFFPQVRYLEDFVGFPVYEDTEMHKRIVHMTTRSYYRDLIQAGVKIYEYRNGFVHSKTFVSDDRIATVGTTNLDFRSLYLHFECGVLMFDSTAVKEIKEDFVQTLEICQPVTEKDCRANFLTRLLQDILRLFAPIM